ncbi:penicillin-binding protein 1A [Azomonas macrocytogenes]|uniref:Penicillin-binding protein 1A n=1 Tax=Azomonas macrocytogenes TaxID=69962 RepID=A0A839T006_AZOMA|nr:penicillin-binding protein 1A [Azomonas macrocytogenes]MBB3102901.1 penicillin-binding protein 1A [Azomonas macrocytogenes]
MPVLKFFLWSLVAAFSALLVGLGGTYLYLSPGQPSVEALRSIQLQIPLRVYSKDEKLIAEFGEMRRSPIRFSQIPQDFINALLAAEDDNFINHYGVDVSSLMRAATQLVQTGHIQTGGSTITMQVAKNYFLTNERSFSRKINEILLALQIERKLTKDEILELYVNKIYLGNRAYGIEAAAQVYFGKSIGELSMAQMAMIAGLPKAPSAYNPLSNPTRSKERRDWILGRMYRLGTLDDARYRQALAEPVDAHYHIAQPELDAPYIAEMARAEMVGRYGSAAYTDGFKVFTTITSERQDAARLALIDGLTEYDQRHGYRGPEARASGKSHQEALQILAQHRNLSGLQAALVTQVGDDGIEVVTRDGSEYSVAWESMKWARPFINTNALGALPRRPANVAKVGDIVRIRLLGDKALFSQIPAAQAALVSLSPDTGSIEALVGGFSFDQSHYNRATQAKRQPGSSFKPFIYSAALDAGFTASSLVNDAPIVYIDQGMNKVWRPQNDTNTFLGPIRLREALYKSRNLVSIRLLQSIGIDYAINYITRFGFNRQDLPRNLSMALGTAALSPLEIATGWTVFANGGYKVEPYLIDHVQDRDGKLIFQANPRRVPPQNIHVSQTNPQQPEQSAQPVDEGKTPIAEPPVFAERIVDERTAYIMTSMLRDVVKRGTGRRAMELGRNDLAGKTGTTNDAIDSWFSGYNSDFVTTVWTGFDQPQTLGRSEFGASVALPIWMKYMGTVLKDRPEHLSPEPSGLISLRVDPISGRAASPRTPNAYFELFKSEETPPSVNEFNSDIQVPGSPLPASEAAPLDLF